MPLGQRNVTHLRTLLPKRTQEVLELMKMQTKDPSQVLVSIAKVSLRRPLPSIDLDQKKLSTKIAQETFQTAMVPTVLQVLTAAEKIRAF
jgi:hypothetical protein